MNLATQPNPDHILFEAHGYTVELSMDESSLLAALHLRYKAYQQSGAIQSNYLQVYEDQYDRQANSRVFAIWQSGKVVGTARNMIFNEDHASQKTLLTDLHQKDIQKHFGKPVTHVETGRLATDPTISGREARILQGILFRAIVSLSHVNKVEYSLIGVRPKHVSFYQRMLDFTPFDWEVDSKPFGGYIMETTCPLHCRFSYSSFDFLNIRKDELENRCHSLDDLYLRKKREFSFAA